MAYLLLPFPILSCSNDEITNSGVPENLTVEVQADRNNPKTFIIQATADNVIKYDFQTAGADEAIEKTLREHLDLHSFRVESIKLRLEPMAKSGYSSKK